MELEILAYVAATLMVVLAYVAYQYFRSSPLLVRRIRGAHAKVGVNPQAVSTPSPPLPPKTAAETDEAAEDPARAADWSSLQIPQEPAATSDKPDAEPVSVEVEETPGEVAALHSQNRPIEDIGTRSAASSGEAAASSAVQLQRLEEELASLPTGIELMDLPILERRRVADRRDRLLDQRVRLLQQEQQGMNRRIGRTRGSPPSG